MEPTMRPKPAPVKCLALALCAVGAGLLAAASGCSHTATDEITSAVVAGERPVAMEGTSAFFGGKVAVKVTLSRGIGHGLKHSAKEREDYTTSEGRVFAGNPVPPVTLHLILTNTSADPVTVQLIDFNSDLGNFVIDPDVLTIAPGQSAEPTPMVSNLGVSSDEIPFTVTLKYGAARESRTVPVTPIALPPAADPAK
jgi:hypothetical protein